MQIIYVHHAERQITENHYNKELRQTEDITERGIEQAKILAERWKDKKIKAIVTSP